MKKRILSVLLTAVLVLSCLPMHALARQQETLEIATAEELSAALADLLDDPGMTAHRDKTLVLTADVELPADGLWFAKGLNTRLDGQGHVITLHDQQLLDAIGPRGQVCNLGLRGSSAGYEYNGSLAKTCSGQVVNCWSLAAVKDTGGKQQPGGLVGVLETGGRVENCFSASTITGRAPVGGLVGRSKTDSTISHCFYLEGSAANAAGECLGTAEACKAVSRAALRNGQVRDLLNAGRGSHLPWTVSVEGFPHFGPAAETEPENGTIITLTRYNGEELTFSAADGLTLYPWEIGTDGLAGTLSCVGGTGWSIDYDTYGKAIMVGASSGELRVSGTGRAEAAVSGADGELARFSITVPAEPEIHALRLTSSTGTVGTDGVLTVSGSTPVHLTPQVLLTPDGAWQDVPPLLFTFTAEEGADVVNNSITARRPGTYTITAAGLGRTARLTMVSRYVPVTAIVPGPSGTYVIHGRNANSTGLGDFLDLNLSHGAGSVVVTPENASYRDSWTLVSDHPEVARYVPDFLRAVLPEQAGTCTLTARTADPSCTDDQQVTGQTTITLEYLNPLTAVTMAETEFQLAVGEELALPITFTGPRSAEGYHVTEPGMTWTCTGDGRAQVDRKTDGVIVANALEYCVANDAYFLRGLEPGTVTFTGTPVDRTNAVEPVTFTVTVTPGETGPEQDFLQLAKDDMNGAAAWVITHHEGDYRLGHEWEILTLTRSGHPLTETQVQTYLDAVESAYKGEEPDMKPTTLARVAMTLSALGQDAASFRGLDFISMMVNSEGMTAGSNEPIWALIALDARSYPVPEGAAWDRQALIGQLLTFQCESGGFALFGTDYVGPDTTGMAIQALAPYMGEPRVDAAVEKALAYLKDTLDADGGYGSAESAAQVLVGLTAMGLDPMDPANGFAADGRNLVANIHTYRDPVSGGFCYAGNANAFSTVQSFYALEAYRRFAEGENRLYDMTDTSPVSARARLAARLDEAAALEERRDDFTQESWSALADAAEQAEQLLNDPLASEARLNHADDALAAALFGLERQSHGGGTDRTVQVSFRLIGSTLSDEDVDVGQGTGNAEYQNWIRTVSYTMPEGTTVGQLFCRATADAGLRQIGAEDNYVRAIYAPAGYGGYALKDMTNGPRSGWMYMVNGRHMGVGMNDFVLHSGDRVVWHYVNDFAYQVEDWQGSAGFPAFGSPETWVDFEALPDTQPPRTGGGSSPDAPAPDGTDLPFRDIVRTDWFYSAVEQVYRKGLLLGTSADTFTPNAAASRGMAVTVLYRMAGCPVTDSRTEFTDVPAGRYCADAVAWADENGIVTGYSDGCFRPDQAVTREELAVLLYRYAVRDKETETGADLTAFPDAERVSAFAAPAMAWAVEQGVIGGTADGRLLPQGTALRCQLAAMVTRMTGK